MVETEISYSCTDSSSHTHGINFPHSIDSFFWKEWVEREVECKRSSCAHIENPIAIRLERYIWSWYIQQAKNLYELEYARFD